MFRLSCPCTPLPSEQGTEQVSPARSYFQLKATYWALCKWERLAFPCYASIGLSSTLVILLWSSPQYFSRSILQNPSPILFFLEYLPFFLEDIRFYIASMKRNPTSIEVGFTIGSPPPKWPFRGDSSTPLARTEHCSWSYSECQYTKLNFSYQSTLYSHDYFLIKTVPTGDCVVS